MSSFKKNNSQFDYSQFVSEVIHSKPDPEMEKLERKWEQDRIKIQESIKKMEQEDAERRAGTRPRIPLSPNADKLIHEENSRRRWYSIESELNKNNVADRKKKTKKPKSKRKCRCK
jgi:hypothetical protein